VSFLHTIVDSVVAALASASIEDEQISHEEEVAVNEARESLIRNGGRGIPHSEAMTRLGLD
jgi:hypothetical protein